MNKNNFLILLCAISCGLITTSTNYSKNNFPDMIDNMFNDLQEMESLMEQTCRHTAHMVNSFNEMIDQADNEATDESTPHKTDKHRININIQPEDQDKLKITCKGIMAGNIKTIPVTKNRFCIKTPTVDLFIKFKHNIISIAAEREETESLNKDENKLHAYSCSKSRVKQYIKDQVDLNNTTIDYDKDEQLLTINIPYVNNEPYENNENKNEILK